MLDSPYISPNTSKLPTNEENAASSPPMAESAESATLKPLLAPDEFRECLGGAIGRNSIYELLRAGRIKHIKIGRKLLIPSSEVEDFPKREVGELA
jgi:excisionase family DNA binding protein